MSFDAIIIVSFGGPEGPDDVLPFLENVLRGRNVPRERMLQVAEHYYQFGGVSPINQQNRDLIAALKKHLEECGPNLPIYWGNRNWHPMLADTLRQMKTDGVKRALAFVTSAYSSYSSCRQYRENIATAQADVPDAPVIEKLRPFYNHPLFIEANVSQINTALHEIEQARRDQAEIVFTAHSIPQSMADNCDYEAQLREAGHLIARTIGHDRCAFVFQSRSGPPTQPWLGPDVCDYVRELPAKGVTDVVLAPIGFVSDHMEILFDLDTEASAVANEVGVNLIRARTVGTHPLFIEMIRQLILERTEPDREPQFIGSRGALPNVCPADCCQLTSQRP